MTDTDTNTETDARETPRTQGPAERALREEWAKYGHGAFKYDGCLLGKLLALDGSYKEFSSGCCTYAADAVGMLLDELGEPQPRADYNDRRVIRCRDCAHFHEWDAPEGHYETCDRGPSNNWVGEDGFCAWAEPKEES